MKKIAFTFILFVLTAASAKASNLYRIQERDEFHHRGNAYSMCHEMVNLLNEPVNNNPQTAEFSIPEGYKNFSLPRWQEIQQTEYSKYLDEEPHVKYEYITLMEKTIIDIDHNGSKETIVRFTKKLDDMPYWHHRPSKKTVAKKPHLEKYGNKLPTGIGFTFFYKGRVYHGRRLVGSRDYYQVIENSLFRHEVDYFLTNYICFFERDK